jgi:hypothetical protein
LKRNLKDFYNLNSNDIFFTPEQWFNEEFITDFSSKYEDMNFEVNDSTEKEDESIEIDPSDVVSIEFI